MKEKISKKDRDLCIKLLKEDRTKGSKNYNRDRIKAILGLFSSAYLILAGVWVSIFLPIFRAKAAKATGCKKILEMVFGRDELSEIFDRVLTIVSHPLVFVALIGGGCFFILRMCQYAYKVFTRPDDTMALEIVEKYKEQNASND